MIEELKGDWVTDEQCLGKVCQKVDEIICFLNNHPAIFKQEAEKPKEEKK